MSKKVNSWKIALVIFLCIVVNYFGRSIAVFLGLPAWLDSFGTVFASYALGPFCGAIVGVSGNLIYGFWDPVTLAYAFTSIFIAVSVGIAAKRGYFETFFHAMSVAGIVTMGAVLISTCIDLFLFQGLVGNAWGEGVKKFLVERNVPYFLGVLIGQFYLDFFDKLITILAFFFGLKLYRWLLYRKQKEAGDKDFAGKKRNGEKRGLHGLSGLCLFLVLGSVCMQSPVVHAQDSRKYLSASYIQTVFNSENGLPCGHANAIAQTNDGILWIGSYAGLYRYNGTEFRFMKEYDSVKNVNCLFADEEGRLWIGTNDSGVVSVIGEKVANVIDSTEGLPSDSVRCIAQSRDGEYYVGTSNGLAVISIQMGATVKETIPGIGYAVSVTTDQDGNVAMVNADGQFFILNSRKVVTSFSLTEGEESLCCCTYDEKRNVFYAGTSDGNIYTYQFDGTKCKQTGRIACARLSKINRIYEKMDGELCICADNGIGFIADGKHFEKQETGNFNFQIENMTVDYQGNMWFTSSRLGLLRLTESAFMDVFSEYGIKQSVVNTTALRGANLYVGTDNGLKVIDTDQRKTVENDLTKFFTGIRIRCIKKDSSGQLWFCSYGKGIVCVDPSGKIISYDAEELGIGNRVRVCEELSDHTIAVGGENGLSFIENGKVSGTIEYGNEIGYAKILCFMERKEGVLLAGTDGNGVVEIEKRNSWKKAKVVKRLKREDGIGSEVILRLVPDLEEGKAFLVTSNGICYFDGEKIHPLNHFPYFNNYDIFLDQDGEMFVLGSAGIYVVNRNLLLEGKESGYQVLNAKMGLMGALTANAWNIKDEGKNLYLSTDRGVFRVNMDAYRMDRKSYRLMVSKIELDDKIYPVERGTEITVERDVKKISFTPEIVNYTLEDPNVAYYLEGLETKKKVIPQSELSDVVYTNLRSGEYVFHLAILSNQTGEVLEESTYRFIKEKSLYDNSWFVFYMVSIAMIFIGWFTWFVTRTWIQKTLELQQGRLQLAMQQVQMGNETILAIAKTVDAKDERTSKHSQRVSDYSVMIAKEYGFTEAEQENLRKAALLHDIGKIAIPDSILNKPARLTDEEYAVMKTHVTKGAEILKDFTLIEHVVEGSKYHHERYDGRGYPEGLVGDGIPLYGRIIAIADAFDAMTANRVYRKKQDFDYVLSELHKGRGTQFDPELLDIFLGLIEDRTIDVDAIYQENKQGEDADE